MLRLILLTPIESGTSTWKSLLSYCLFNCWPSVQVRVIKLIISSWFTTPNKTSALNVETFKCSAFVSVCCQLYCSMESKHTTIFTRKKCAKKPRFVYILVSGRSGPKPVWPQVVPAQVDPAPCRFGSTINFSVIN